MKYYFGGSEIKSWKDLLEERQIPTVALSFMGLKRRVKKILDWKISDHYPENTQVFLDSGAYTLNKDLTKYSAEDARVLAEEYMKFAEINIDFVSLVSEFDASVLGHEYIRNARDTFWNNFPPEKFMPIWHPEYGHDELEELCSQYEIVGVTQLDIHDTSLIPLFNQVIHRYGVRLHGVAITSKEMLKSVAWDSVSSMSWLSPSVYGDTIIWTGRELKRYPKAYKDQARKKHRNIFRDNGFDETKIEADDSTELLRLSLWSWQQFTESLVTTHGKEQNGAFNDSTNVTVGTQGHTAPNEKLLPVIKERRETQTIPVMGLAKIAENPEEDDSKEIPFIYTRSESMRACNTCFLREKCPGFKPDANCLYNIPIEIKTKDQLKAVKEAIIEMQTQRVLFMKMAEDLEGGYADPNLSSELDRLSRLIKNKEDSEKDTFSMTVTATQSSGPSFMAKTFGSAAHDKLQQLDRPVKADDLIKDSEVFEAELVDE